MALLGEARADGQFTSLPAAPPWWQKLWAVGGTSGVNGLSRDFLVGEAFAPDNGGIWVSDAQSATLRLFQFPGTWTKTGPTVPDAAVKAVTFASLSQFMCMANDHFDKTLFYAMTPEGLVQISFTTMTVTAGPWRPTPPAGQQVCYAHLAVAVNPVNGTIYFTVQEMPTSGNCGSFWDTPAGKHFSIWSVSPPIGSSFPSNTQREIYSPDLSEPPIDDIDGLAVDPSGSYLFGALNQSAQVLDVNLATLNYFRINSSVGGTPHYPDGMAFHTCNDNFLLSNDNNGTLTKYVFPGANHDDYAAQPTVTTFASGGFRGDFAEVGPDQSLYLTQWAGGPSTNGNQFVDGTRYEPDPSNGNAQAVAVTASLVQLGPCFMSALGDSACRKAPAGMTDWWQLDETVPGATIAADAVGNYAGTIAAGIVSAVGYSNNAFYFPNTTPPAFVDCGNQAGKSPIHKAANGDPYGGFSIDAWVKFDAIPSGCAVVVSKWQGTTKPVGYQLVVNNSLQAVFAVANGSGTVVSATSAILPLHQWVHLTGVAQINGWITPQTGMSTPVAYGTELFVNGVLVAYGNEPPITAATCGPGVSSTAHFTIGGFTSSCPFGGFIDEVEFFDRALSLPEVFTLGTHPKCKCRIVPCANYVVGPSQTHQTIEFQVCNDGSQPVTVHWNINEIAGNSNAYCNKSGVITNFSPSNGAQYVPAHGCVTVDVSLTLVSFVLNSESDHVCYAISSLECGQGSSPRGSLTGTAGCAFNPDSCFVRHGGWGNGNPIPWTVQNPTAFDHDLSWYVAESGAESDSLYPVVSLNGLALGTPTSPVTVHVPAFSSTSVSVSARIVQAAAQQPTHLQLFSKEVGAVQPAVVVSELDLSSDESDGSRFSDWAAFSPDSTPPPTRANGSMIFDAANNRFVLFGGSGDVTGVWTCSSGAGARWIAIAPAGPTTGRDQHQAVYDSNHHRMLVFGGDDFFSDVGHNSDVWSLDLTLGHETWSKLVVSGAAPQPRSGHTMVYDPVRDQVIIYGGFHSVGFGGTTLGDAWALKLSGTGTPAWVSLPSDPAVSSLQGHTAVYDPVAQRMIVTGGTGQFNATSNSGALYALSLSGTPTWSTIVPTGATPPRTFAAFAALDPNTNTLTLLGGQTQSGPANSNIWSISLVAPNAWFDSTPFSGSPTSARVSAMGPPVAIDGFFYLYGGSTQTASAVADFVALPSLRGGGFTTTVAGTPPATPVRELSLRVQPNPFRVTTTLRLAIPSRVPVSLGIYDIAGRRLWTRELGVREAGDLAIPWNGIDDAGQPVQAGIFFVRARAGDRVLDSRIIRIH